VEIPLTRFAASARSAPSPTRGEGKREDHFTRFAALRRDGGLLRERAGFTGALRWI
jgi:hypothetical protein